MVIVNADRDQKVLTKIIENRLQSKTILGKKVNSQMLLSFALELVEHFNQPCISIRDLPKLDLCACLDRVIKSMT